MNVKALVIVIVAALAAAGWFFFSQGGTEQAPQGHLPGAATAGDKGKAAERTDAEAALLASDPKTTDAAAERTVAPTASLPASSDKDYTVRGRLVDKTGAPRAGVALVANTWKTTDGFDFDALPGGLAAGRPRATSRSTTAADGTFRFVFANDQSASLTMPDDDLVFEGAQPHARGGAAEQDLGDVVALRAAALRGIVRDQNGQPVPDVKVAATVGLIGTTSEDKTALDGTFTVGKLRPGKWVLRTMSGRFLPTVEEFTLAAEEQRVDLVLVVRPGNAIAGQVVDDRGVGVANMKVASKRKESRGGVDVERFTSDEATVTDSNGYFTLAGLPDESATMRVFGPGHTSATMAEVAVGTGNVLVRVERLGVIEGVLLGSNGTPIAGSRVTAQAAAQTNEGLAIVSDLDFDPLADGEARTKTAVDGTFRIDNVKPGTVIVSARGDGHRPVRQSGLSVLPGQSIKGVRLLADLGAVARVQVLDDEGKPVADATVTIKKPSAGEPGNGMFRARRVEVNDIDGEMHVEGPNSGVGTAKSNQEGIAIVSGLPAGDFQVLAKHANLAPAVPVSVALPKSGTVEATLRMRRPGQAEITVVDAEGAPVAAIELIVRAADASSQIEPVRATTNERGVAQVGGLTAGEYTAALTRPPEGSQIGDVQFVLASEGPSTLGAAQPFSIQAGSTVRVELLKPTLTTLRGTVTGADGPVAGAVVALSDEESAGMDLGGLSDGRSVTTDADGSYSIDNIVAGHYVLRYGMQDQMIKATLPLDVPKNQKEVRQDLVLRTGTVRVQVIAKDGGEAISGAEVELQRDDEPGSATPKPRERRVMMMTLDNSGPGGGGATTMTLGAKRARTDDDGFVEIPDVPVGTYTMNVRHKRYAAGERKGLAVVERQQTDCGQMELTAAGTIRGKVVAADGKAVPMALVQRRKVGGQDDGEPTMAMGGSFRLTGLSAGKYEVRGQALGETQSAYSPWQEVDVKIGETTVAEIKLPQ